MNLYKECGQEFATLYDGNPMPRLGLGTWKVNMAFALLLLYWGLVKITLHILYLMHLLLFYCMKAPAAKTKAAVKTAVKAGYRMIDCANDYDNEHVIGEALQQLFKEGVVQRSGLLLH